MNEAPALRVFDAEPARKDQMEREMVLLRISNWRQKAKKITEWHANVESAISGYAMPMAV